MEKEPVKVTHVIDAVYSDGKLQFPNGVVFGTPVKYDTSKHWNYWCDGCGATHFAEESPKCCHYCKEVNFTRQTWLGWFLTYIGL